MKKVTKTLGDHAAAQCRTLVISSARGLPDRAETLGNLIRDGGKDGRFDLLTVLAPRQLASPGPLLDQLAADAKLAVELHRGEQIVVATYDDPAPIVSALKRRPEFKTGGVEIIGVDLARKARRGYRIEDTPTLAVTCMDFRQHDDGFAEKLQAELDLDDLPAVLAMAGGAKDLTDATARGKMIFQELATRRRGCAFKQVALTCHTDCGAFGGDASEAFRDKSGRPDPDRQRRTLEERLRAAALAFRVAFPSTEIVTGIVRIDAAAGRIAEIIRT